MQHFNISCQATNRSLSASVRLYISGDRCTIDDANSYDTLALWKDVSSLPLDLDLTALCDICNLVLSSHAIHHEAFPLLRSADHGVQDEAAERKLCAVKYRICLALLCLIYFHSVSIAAVTKT